MATTKTLEELLAEQLANGTTTTQVDVPAPATAPATTAAPAQAAPEAQTQVTQPQTTYDASALNLPGISSATKQALTDLVSNGYKPSATVDAALKELNDIIEAQPGTFNSQYQKQIDDIMAAINGRDAFSYDANSDAAYQQYKDLYTQMGQKGMMNTLGQAAALTGGYGSSYANSAAQQTYNDYMTQLTGQVPTLRSAALNEYNNQGNALNQQYAMANDAYSREYGAYQDAYSRWMAQQQMAQDTYNTERGFDYANYQNQLDYWYNIANQEAAQAASDKEYAYSTAMSMLQLGKMPSDDLLATAGISAADAKKIYNKYKTKKSRSSSSSGSRSRSSSGSSSPGSSSGWSGSVSDMYKAIQAAVAAQKVSEAGKAAAGALKKKRRITPADKGVAHGNR